jgi:cell division protein ZapA
MIEQNEIISIKLLDREYKIKCPNKNIPDLQEAAQYLDQKLRELSENSNYLNQDRFMITALNIAHEFIKLSKQKTHFIENMNQRILELQSKIEQALDL